MAKIYPLDKVLSANVTYETERDRYYVIKKIGTNIADAVTPRIAGIPTTKIHGDFAPLHKTTSNFHGPLDLGLKYIVIPPERKFVFESATAGKVKIIGDLVVLAPGESMLGEHLSRFGIQDRDYITYVEGSYTIAGGASWPAGVEFTVFSLTPPIIEEYTFKSYVFARVLNTSAALSDGQVGVKFLLNDVPLDILSASAGPFGIDLLSMPWIPAGTTELTPFSLENYPIVVPGGHTLTVKFVNISGAAIAPATGQNIIMQFRAIAHWVRKV
jgi:hypothetical protein